MQKEDGSYNNGFEDAQTEAMVITVLVDLGYDPFSLEFKGLANRILQFKNSDGSYSSYPDGGDDLATPYVLMALSTLTNGKSPFKILAENNSFVFN